MNYKLQITFDEQEKEELYGLLKREHWQHVLWDLDQWLRHKYKYNNEESIKIEEVRDKIYSLMKELDLEFE